MDNFYIPPLPFFDGQQSEAHQNEYRPLIDGSHLSNIRPQQSSEITTSYHQPVGESTSMPMTMISGFDPRSMQYVSNHFQTSTTPILIVPQQNSSGQFVLAPDSRLKELKEPEKIEKLSPNNPQVLSTKANASKKIKNSESQQLSDIKDSFHKNKQLEFKKIDSETSSANNGHVTIEANEPEGMNSEDEFEKGKSDINNSSVSLDETSDLDELDIKEKMSEYPKSCLKTCVRCKAMFTNLTDKGVLTSDDNNFICQSCQKSSESTARDLVFTVSYGEKSQLLNLGQSKKRNFSIKLKGLIKQKDNLTLEVICGEKVEKLDILHADLANGELSIECHDAQPTSRTTIPPNVKQFPCSDCGESFLDTKTLSDHKLTHPGHKPWVCLECGKEFKFNNLMIRHQLSHTDIKDFSCGECGRKFRNKANLKRHHKSVHVKELLSENIKESVTRKEAVEERDLEQNDDLYAVDDGQPVVEDPPELIEEKYLEVIASRPKSTNLNKFRPKIKYYCKICNKGFGNKGKWKRHELYHFQLRMPICEQCGKSFVDKDYLMEHLRMTHEEMFPEYICKECGLEFPFKDELQHHILNHDNADEPINNTADLINVPPNEDGQFQCPECEKVFRSNYILQRHYMTHNRSTCMCQECGKFYSCRYNLVQHMMIHENKDNYICDQCGESFKVKQYLSRHMIKHREQKTWACNICDLKFYRQGNLRHHMKQHVENKPYQCQHCPKSFVRARTLEEHVLLSHSEDRPYQCTICGRGFALERMLKPHMKIHSGFKEHKCEQCGKLFTYKSNLNQHMMIHSGEKPFICQFCGKGFARNKYLNDHMRTHNMNPGNPSF